MSFVDHLFGSLEFGAIGPHGQAPFEPVMPQSSQEPVSVVPDLIWCEAQITIALCVIPRVTFLTKEGKVVWPRVGCISVQVRKLSRMALT